jgi:peptidoglycan hydrolase FlgJ
MLYVNPLDNIMARSASFGEQQKEKLAYQELEQLLAYSVLQEMRKSVPENGLFGNSAHKRTFDNFLDEAMSKVWAESGQLGVADQLLAEAERNSGGKMP